MTAPTLKDPPIKLKAMKVWDIPDPEYKTAGAVAFDLVAALNAPITLRPMERRLIPTGLILEIPEGFEGQVRPRSGTALRKGLSMVNTPGTIDTDFRGELQVLAINLNEGPVTIEPLERIAQMVISPIVKAEFEWVSEFSETDRGSGGFGSTGAI